MSHSQENPWAGQGSVLLDIGDEVGALVVEMPLPLRGVEVEVRPAGAAPDRSVHLPHVAVVDRPIGAGRTLACLVFPELREGRYELMLKGSDAVEMTALIEGGSVTQLTWSGRAGR